MQKEIVLLGAGASVDAKNPTSYELTKRLAVPDKHLPAQSAAIQYAIAGLLLKRSEKGHNPFDSVNVEEVFNALELLAERDHLEISPFVGTWASGIENLETQEMYGDVDPLGTLYAELYNPILNKLHGISSPGNQLDNIGIGSAWHKQQFGKAFQEAVRQSAKIGRRGALFRHASIILKDRLFNELWIPPIQNDRVAYLDSLVQHAHKNKITIATLNYDNSVELSAQRTNIEVDFGLDSFFKTNEIIFDPTKLALIKLHGSLDWRSDLRLIPSDDWPVHQLIVEQYQPEKETVSDFAIIFGHRNKLTADGPFLKLFIAFEKHLSEATLLTIIGYSFGDDHVNSLICQWLNGEHSRTARVISQKEGSVNHLPFCTDEHASFLAKRFEFIGGGGAQAIGKLYQ